MTPGRAVIALRRVLSLVIALAALVAAWALTQPFHEVTIQGADAPVMHTGLTHHSWGLMFIPTALVLAVAGIAGAWSARPRALVFARVTAIAALTWSLVVLTDGLLTDYLMTRGPALLGEQVFLAARAVIAGAGVALAALAFRERAGSAS